MGRNSVKSIFAPGEGETIPPGINGRIASSPILPRPALPVKVFLSGVEQLVEYAGAAPGLASGIFQVNARIPANLPVATHAIELRVGPQVSFGFPFVYTGL